MKIILVFVTTLDGKITKWGLPDVRIWTSGEDQKYFSGLWKTNRLIVMGSKTFNVNPVKVSSGQHIVVMTRFPEQYKNQEIPGSLEFVSQSPASLAERFAKEGYMQMMVAGGAHVATSFLKEQLIDEIWLTIEPKIFGTGGNFVIEESLDMDLQLLSYEKVNEQGTLITKYAVIKK